MPDIFPDVQGQTPISIGISAPLASTDPGQTFAARSMASGFTAGNVGTLQIGVSAPLGAMETFGPPYVLDIYLAYLTFQCPPMPVFGGTGQIFPSNNGLAGDNGKTPILRKTATHLQWSLNNADWNDLIALGEITGPAGAPAYVHNQSTQAGTWVINHNLGYRPSVEVFDSGSSEIIAEVVHPTVNQAVVTVNPATAGFARLT
jgi:hypothetical protein